MVTTETQTEERTIISAWVPANTARDLRARAAREDRSLSAEIRRAITAHLDDALRREERGRS